MNTKQKSVKSLIVALGLIATSVSLGAEGGASHYAPGFYGDFGVAVAPEPGFYLRNDLYTTPEMPPGTGSFSPVKSGQISSSTRPCSCSPD